MGFSSTTNSSERDALVERALEAAPFGALAHLDFPAASAYPPVEVYDPQVEEVSMEAMEHMGQGLIDAVRAAWPQVLCEGRVSRSLVRMELLNSRGCQASYRKATFNIHIEGVLIEDTDMLFVSESQSSCHPIADITLLKESVLLQLERASRIAKVPTRTMPVVFTPHGLAGVLLGPLLSGLNGKMVLRGTSPLAGRLGERVADERISLWDDPTQPFVPGSRICDDEGVPSRVTPLLKDGVAANFLYDLQTAAQAGALTTASAERSLGSLPSPAPGVLYFAPGDASWEDMLSDMGEGLVVERLLGAGQGNTLGGDFNANVLLGYYVEKGRVVGRAKDVMVSGNVYQVLNTIAGVGKETHWVWGFLNAPHLYCSGVAVAAKR
ncbi:MAG: hypothetical protein HW388_1059 [Dehalococcoidia bacterium]|nr:hypothetical protein [Dehalococcoidia bacterium]